MTEEKIRHAACAITELAGQVKPEHWDLLANIRSELLDAADQVRVYETCLPVEMLGQAAAQEARP
jgi:hypothetical protein